MLERVWRKTYPYLKKKRKSAPITHLYTISSISSFVVRLLDFSVLTICIPSPLTYLARTSSPIPLLKLLPGIEVDSSLQVSPAPFGSYPRRIPASRSTIVPVLHISLAPLILHQLVSPQTPLPLLQPLHRNCLPSVNIPVGSDLSMFCFIFHLFSG